MPEQHPTLRAHRRAETQRVIQAHAVRLFTERGYDATTVTDVAEAAGVSPMTVYRHFPTKEDLVLVDEHAQLVAERIAAASAAQPLVRRIGDALIDSAAALTAAGPSGSPADGRGGGPGDGRGGGPGDGRGGGRMADEQFLLARLRLMISTPALRARHLDNNYALQQAIVDALGIDATDPDSAFHARAAISACLAAMHTALVRWAEDDGRTALPDLIAKALAAAFGDDLADAGPRAWRYRAEA